MRLSALRFRPLTNAATAKIFTSLEVKIFAYFVNKGCKIGYIGFTMRPHLQPLFPCLATFFRVWQSVDFVNILKRAVLRLFHLPDFIGVFCDCAIGGEFARACDVIQA